IRDGHVTGVQTCALPIFTFVRASRTKYPSVFAASLFRDAGRGNQCARKKKIFLGQLFSRQITRRTGRMVAWSLMSTIRRVVFRRSEERRVGKECRDRWWA